MTTWLREALRLQAAAIRVAGRCALLPFTCPFVRSDRHRTWRLFEALFGADRLGVYPEIAESLLGTPSLRVNLTCLSGESYNVTEHELLVISTLAARVRPRRVFEFGTANGRTTVNLALNTPDDATIYTLNLPLDRDSGHVQTVPVGATFHGDDLEAKIVQLWGDSREFDYAPFAGACQMVFIDADHSEDGVAADTGAALNLVDREHGVIVWHDALRFGVQRVLPRLARIMGPVHLVSRTNLAILCFACGHSVTPDLWKPTRSADDDRTVAAVNEIATCDRRSDGTDG